MVAKIQVTNRSTAKVYVYADGASRPLVKENASAGAASPHPEEEFLAFSDEPAAEVTGSRDKGAEGQRRVTGPGGSWGAGQCTGEFPMLLPLLSAVLLGASKALAPGVHADRVSQRMTGMSHCNAPALG